MIEIERNIFVDNYCLTNEYDLCLGNKTKEIVTFQYYNIKSDKEGKAIQRTYTDALNLARERANDGRYKNYHFLIYKN